MKQFTILLLAVCLSIGLTNTLVAQAKKGRKMPSQEEMMKRWNEAATPTDHHKAYEKFVGQWETVSKTWMGGDDAPPTEGKGSSEYKMTLGGRFLQMDFSGEMMGQMLTGLGLMGYDNFKKKHTMFWIDNSGTAMFTAEGTMDAAGTTITLWGKMDDPATARRTRR